MVAAHPESYIRYYRGIEKLFGYLSQRTKRDWKTETLVYYGEPGTGKSRTAKEIADARGGGVYYKTRGDWWDGYQGEESVIIDDFYGWLKYDEILRLTDRYPLQVPIKGGFTEFLAKLIIITSNRPIREWYSGAWFTDISLRALMRRIDTYESWLLINNETVRTDLLIENEINEFLN